MLPDRATQPVLSLYLVPKNYLSVPRFFIFLLFKFQRIQVPDVTSETILNDRSFKI